MDKGQYTLPLHSPSFQPPPQYQQQQQSQQQPPHSGPAPYNSSFADSMTTSVLSKPSRIRQTPSPISPSPAAHFPVPMESPLRQHPSHLHPNLKLTHPNGRLHGGPAPFAPHALRAHAQDIVEINRVGSKKELESYILRELGKKGDEIEQLLKERQKIKEGNARVTGMIRALEEEREVEIRMEERWRNEKERKGR